MAEFTAGNPQRRFEKAFPIEKGVVRRESRRFWSLHVYQSNVRLEQTMHHGEVRFWGQPILQSSTKFRVDWVEHTITDTGEFQIRGAVTCLKLESGNLTNHSFL